MTEVSWRWIGALLAIALAALALTYLATTATPPAAAGEGTLAKADRDCDDFRTQKKAQKFFKKHHPRRDPHDLDRDNDRIACENNPCPCAAAGGISSTVAWRC